MENSVQDRRGLQISYLTENVSWQADYILTLNNDESKADLDGWVTLVNQSGAAYRNAKLKLVAGDVQRIRSRPVMAHRATLEAQEFAAVVTGRQSFF